MQQETHLIDAGAGWWKQGTSGSEYLSFKISQDLAQGDYVLAIPNQYKKEPHQPDMILRLRVDGPPPPQQTQQNQRGRQPQRSAPTPRPPQRPTQQQPQRAAYGRPTQGRQSGYSDPYPEATHTDDDIPF